MLALALVGAVVAVSLWRINRAPRRPGHWRIANRTLIVEDAAGRRLFSRDLGQGRPGSFARDPALPEEQQFVRFLDLDGDGTAEIVARSPDNDRVNKGIICFDSSGQVRFNAPANASVRFGDVDYGDPWFPSWIADTPRPDGSRSLWVIWTHNTWFPSRLVEISPRGETLSEYWSDGHLRLARALRLGGREVVVVGGTNNELRGASVAVFDRGHLSGHAPAIKDDYLCHSCAPGGPREFLVLPSAAYWKRVGGASTVNRVAPAPDGGLDVSVLADRGLLPDGRVVDVEATYRFTPSLALASVIVGQNLRRIEVPPGPGTNGAGRHTRASDDDLFPVQRWDGSRFVPLPRAPVLEAADTGH